MDYMEVTAIFLAVTLAAIVFTPVNPYAWSPTGMPAANVPEINNYTPPLGVDLPLVGDVWYSVNLLFTWFASIRDTSGAILAALGIPQEWSAVLTTLVVFFFALFTINIISGRVIRYSGGAA